MNERLENQRFWIQNEAGYYNMANRALRGFKPLEKAATALFEDLQFLDDNTPDGHAWTYEGVLAALKGLK